MHKWRGVLISAWFHGIWKVSLCATHEQVYRSGGNAARPDAKFNKSLVLSVRFTPSGNIISLNPSFKGVGIYTKNKKLPYGVQKKIPNT